MPYVVGLVSSPRKGMNTDTLVSDALEGASSVGAQVEKIYLDDLSIRPCKACARPPTTELCVIHDGMDVIYRVLQEADALVIGTPAYYDTIAAQLKLVVDRGNCMSEILTAADGKITFRSRLPKTKGALLIWVSGTSRDPEPALASLRLWLKDARIELHDRLSVFDADRGEGARHKGELLREAREKGTRLAQMAASRR